MIVAFSVSPPDVGEDVGEYVADAVRVVRESGLPHRTDAMSTSVEGEWDEGWGLPCSNGVERWGTDVGQACRRARAGRVSPVLKAGIRPGVTDGLMTSEVETVERPLAG
ncbi:MTH1187 family thiamine-binding protein [Streptomyces sp. NPDC058637]|uniref:thiamine-binding protein n=1 Tax=Streptomyces sp. NPDC058637 TaxID=3346569 RepID=UPI0036563E7E